MSDNALRMYLNDHYAGSTLGLEHAEQLTKLLDDTPHAASIAMVAKEIEEDRDFLIDLMEKADATPNHVKAASAWVAQKASRIKFNGLTSRDRALGTFLALETMSLGVEGKRDLWVALDRVSDKTPALREVDFERLIARAESQRERLEAAREEYADVALA